MTKDIFDVKASVGDLTLKFDGRTVVVEFAVANTISHDNFGKYLRGLASGPLQRLNVVFQYEMGPVCAIAILVNTDEEADTVKERLLAGLKGDPDKIKCRVASEEESKVLWATTLERARARHEQQDQPKA